MLREQTNQIYQELRRRILDGALKPAENLPEVTLAQEFKASRGTIKKALLKLENENLVVIEENKRAKVRWFTKAEVMQYLEVRELLECFIVRQSSSFLSIDDLEEMHTALWNVKKSLEEHQFLKYSEYISSYYTVLYRVCPNRPAVEIIMTIKNQLKRYNIKTILIPGRAENSFDEHKKILISLKNGDVDSAEALMHIHISNMRTVIQEHFDFFM